MKNTLRPAVAADRDAIAALYKKVTRLSGGLARREEEITAEYIDEILQNVKKAGLQFVMMQDESIVGEIHCYKPGLQCFDHLLSDLTIAVDPDVQGQGIGKTLFAAVLSEVKENRPDILRIELLTGEANKRAIAFYQSLGFTIEGRMPNRYRPGPADLARSAAEVASAEAAAPASAKTPSPSKPDRPTPAPLTSPKNPTHPAPPPFDADIPMAWMNPNFSHP